MIAVGPSDGGAKTLGSTENFFQPANDRKNRCCARRRARVACIIVAGF
jgi:hypothetical protein